MNSLAGLESDYAAVQAYAKSHARGYGVGAEWLPKPRRAHAEALLAFAMHTDTLADGSDGAPAERRARFEEWRVVLDSVRAGVLGRTGIEWRICRAFAHTANHFRFSPDTVDLYLDAQAAELEPTEFGSFNDLERHAQNLIGTTCAWANLIYGGTSPEAERRSRHLGIAAQLSDYLVDLKQDLSRGKLYLPLEDLDRFEVTRKDLEQAAATRSTPRRVRQLIMFEAERTLDYCDSGSGWNLLVDESAREAARLPEIVYRYQATEMIRSGGDIFGSPPLRVEELGELRDPELVSRAGSSRLARSGAVPRLETDDPPAVSDQHLPRHVGIVLDGNRRWARKHGVPIPFAHMRGESVLRNVTEDLFARGIEYLSVYLFSTENWRRDAEQVSDLMALLTDVVSSLGGTLLSQQIRLRFLGRSEDLPARLRRAISHAENLTARNTGGTLAICVNYGGQAEITDAVRSLMAHEIDIDSVTPELISQHLYAPDIPPVDLLIRTGGEQRLSNFMLWRTAYSEIEFLPILWPDFSIEDVDAVLTKYRTRTRRFGA